jgi:apolipoprotein D and lipocalin family protein
LIDEYHIFDYLYIMYKIIIFLTSALSFLSLYGKDLPPLETVKYVDLKKYTGTWYEIARYPNRFQKDCVGTFVNYTLREDGKINVLNQCYDKSFEGKLKQSKGVARVVDNQTNAKLKVSFFWPFEGDYWIIDLAEDYRYAVVGEPDRKYLWILSRNKTMDEETYNQILLNLETKHHYDTSKLIKTVHK